MTISMSRSSGFLPATALGMATQSRSQPLTCSTVSSGTTTKRSVSPPGQDQGIEAGHRGIRRQLGVVEEGQLVGDRGEVGAALFLSDLCLALDRDTREPAGEIGGAPDPVPELLPLARPHGQHAVQGLQRAPLGRLPGAHPGHVAGDDGAGRFVEVPAVLVAILPRRGEQRVEQDVDVAHREALVLADERERVVSRACHRRQVASLHPDDLVALVRTLEERRTGA